MYPDLRPLLITLAAALAPCAHAGSVEVNYDARATFTDAGTTPAERERHLAALAGHLKRLGERRLVEGSRLSVELVDLDLTGTLRPSRRTAQDLRVVTGRADGPHIELRYTLSDASQVLASGRETLFDASLPRVGDARNSDGGDPLRHEKSLLDHWFEARIASAPAATR
ncbi:DUF3016 domain-containing protein [Variovorax sp. YR752]|uniref:DUF3016 domain-containing protein n=1 Tax=Variovorax sp. YR752 TaxID=1884383 RepID=UPI003137BFC7